MEENYFNIRSKEFEIDYKNLNKIAEFPKMH